jgi:hypothetical protein
VVGGIWRADLFSNDRGALSEPQVSFDEQAHTVAIEVPLDEGGVYRLSSVTIDDEERPLPAWCSGCHPTIAPAQTRAGGWRWWPHRVVRCDRTCVRVE